MRAWRSKWMLTTPVRLAPCADTQAQRTALVRDSCLSVRVSTSQNIFPLDNPDVANSLNNLALLYKVQGKYAQAEPLYQSAHAIREKVLPLDHSNVATSLNNPAMLYQAQGKYVQAEPLYQR